MQLKFPLIYFRMQVEVFRISYPTFHDTGGGTELFEGLDHHSSYALTFDCPCTTDLGHIRDPCTDLRLLHHLGEGSVG